MPPCGATSVKFNDNYFEAGNARGLARARVFKIFKIFKYLKGGQAQCLCGVKSVNGTFGAVNGTFGAVKWDVWCGKWDVWCGMGAYVDIVPI